MKNSIIIFAIFLSTLLSYQFTYAQWVQRYNGPGNYTDFARAVAVDDSGNVYVTGSSNPTPLLYATATIKYNSSGVEQWVQNAEGEANSITVDDSGNVYITGSSSIGIIQYTTTRKYNSSGVQKWVKYAGPNGSGHSIAVDGSGNVYMTGHTSSDYLTIKYNLNGDTLWVRTYGLGTYLDRASSISIDDSGNVYVTGISGGTSTSDDFATIKYNSSGVQQWIQRYNGPGNDSDGANSIAVDSLGNVYVTGGSTGIGTGYDYATIKYNLNGDSIWVKRYNSPGNVDHDVPNSIKVDGSGNVYVSGGSIGIGTNYDYATIKYSSNGDSIWIKRYNGPTNGYDLPYSNAIDHLGNVYVTGLSIPLGTTNGDYVTIKYNSSGIQEWVQRYNGPGNSSEQPSSMTIDNFGNVYVTGGSIGIGTNNDYATIKYSQQPTPALDLTALIEGFYNNATNTMVRDTVKVYLRNSSFPYLIVDSAKSVLEANGYQRFNFPNAVNGILYYIVIKHRNSIETWNSQGKMFTDYQLSYDFVTAANKAFGNNLKLKGSKYCIYSGDVNQDGIVDAGDLSLVDNDAFSSVSGYVNTDVTGDNSVDASDLSVVNNNAFTGVIKLTP